MNARRALKRGFTLVELMIVVAIIGILAALAIYGVRKYIANSKTAEARNSLGQMAEDAVSAYQREHMDGTVLAAGGTSKATHALCLSATESVPKSAASIKGMKYQSAPADWDKGDQNTGWKCLRFTMDQPQYYMYSYTSPDVNNFQAIAQGDLDGDGTLSKFELDGRVDPKTGAVTRAPSIAETNPEE